MITCLSRFVLRGTPDTHSTLVPLTDHHGLARLSCRRASQPAEGRSGSCLMLTVPWRPVVSQQPQVSHCHIRRDLPRKYLVMVGPNLAASAADRSWPGRCCRTG